MVKDKSTERHFKRIAMGCYRIGGALCVLAPQGMNVMYLAVRVMGRTGRMKCPLHSEVF